MRLRSAVALAVSAALATVVAGAATAAAAPTLRTTYPCYGSGESVLINGAGFTPQGEVAISLSGQQLATLTTDPDGAFSARLEAPAGLFGTLRMRLRASDRTRPGLRAGATIRIADTDVLVTPAVGAPARVRRIRAWGFFGAQAVYAHLKRRGSPGVRNIRLGSPRGACGGLEVKRRLFPTGVRPGAYTLQFDALRRYYPNLDPSVSYLVAIARSGPSTTHTASDRPGGLPPATPFNPARVTRVARFTTTSRFAFDPFFTGRSSRHWKLTSPRSL